MAKEISITISCDENNKYKSAMIQELINNLTDVLEKEDIYFRLNNY